MKNYKIGAITIALTVSMIGQTAMGAPVVGAAGTTEAVDNVANVATAGFNFESKKIPDGDEHPAIKAYESRVAGRNTLYEGIAITLCDNYVNIRTNPSADSELVGKIYNNSGAYIDDAISNTEGNWYRIHSGNCVGYVLQDFFVTGKEARDIAAGVSSMRARVKADSLNLRKTPSFDGEALTTLSQDEDYEVISDNGEFVELRIDSDLTGYVLSDYVKLSISFKEAITIEEERAELARQAEQERQRREAEAAMRNRSTNNSSSKSSGTSGRAGSAAGPVSNSRQGLVDYACSFVGVLPYVYGGNSLVTGTDCSGFVHMIFAKVGISVGRTDTAIRGNGRQISPSEMRPGDIVCYYGHVAIYIGNGQIVHASSANSTPNTKISSNWNYRSVACIVNPWGD